MTRDEMTTDGAQDQWAADLLAAGAPRPTVEFSLRLYHRLQTGRATRRAGFWSRIGNAFNLNGGLDMRKSAMALPAVIILAAVLVVAAVPSARAEFVAAVRRIALGDSTEVRQIEPVGEPPPGDYPWQLPQGTYWIVETDVGKYGANVLPGESDAVRSAATLDEAEALAGVRPPAPAELPDGYTLREIQVSPNTRPTFFQFYAGPGPDIVIIQTPVGDFAGETAGESATTVVSTVTDGTIEAVTFDGRPAAWIDGRVLKWEAGGWAIDVGGLGLDLATAMAIGRSLR